MNNERRVLLLDAHGLKMIELYLGDPVVAAALEKAKQLDWHDAAMRGLFYRTYLTGKRGWFLRYYVRSKAHTVALGNLSPEGARVKATALLQTVTLSKQTDGVIAHPASERKAARQAVRKAKAERQDVITFKALAERYLQLHAKPNKRSWADDAKRINHKLLPEWSSRDAASIARRDVAALLDAIYARGAGFEGNRTRTLIHKIFKFALSRDIVGINPVAGYERQYKEEGRSRVLDPAELRLICNELEPQNVRDWFRFAVGTAQRPGECWGARWDEVNLEAGTWTVPIRRSKTYVYQTTPLVGDTLALLRRRHGEPGSPIYIFGPGTSVDKADASDAFATRVAEAVTLALGGSWPDATYRLERAIGEAKARIIKAHSMEPWQGRDVRRSAVTHMSELLEIDNVTLDRVLNHTDPTVLGRHYNRNPFARQKFSALTKWNATLHEIVTGEKIEQPRGEVIPFPVAAA
jgi:integrase